MLIPYLLALCAWCPKLCYFYPFFFSPTLEECLRWKQSFEKLLASKRECAHLFLNVHLWKTEACYAERIIKRLVGCPQVGCVPSPPSWCLSSVRRTSHSTLPARITGTPNLHPNCLSKPRRFLMSSSARMLPGR